MKKFLLPILALALISACSTRRQMEKAVGVGNYDQAIYNAVDKLKINKDRKGKEDVILLLHEAYNKASSRDLNDIEFLKRDQNPENFIKIYDKYVLLDNRQELIKPLLPLYAKRREVHFKFNDYASDIVNYKNKASDHMYKNAVALLKSNNKFEVRRAYDNLRTIENINPNFKDVRKLMDVAHDKGSDFVIVDVTNESGKIIPSRLQKDLLNFSNYGLNNFWVVYHNAAVKGINYDFKMKINFRNINISPEQIKERQIVKERQVPDGKKVLLNERGDVVKDSLGKPIQVDVMRTVTCQYYEFTQFKSAQVTGNVEYVNLKTKQLEDAFPVSSEFVFQHIYATHSGDRRALEDNLLVFLDRRAVPFPTEEQMVFDAGEDLKMQIKKIINSYNFN